jgi:hypothetical protein
VLTIGSHAAAIVRGSKASLASGASMIWSMLSETSMASRALKVLGSSHWDVIEALAIASRHFAPYTPILEILPVMLTVPMLAKT